MGAGLEGVCVICMEDTKNLPAPVASEIYSLGWYHSFGSDVRSYEYHISHKEYMAPLLFITGEGGSLLDVGSGGGSSVYAYRCAGLDAYGVDLGLITGIARQNYPEVADRLLVVDLTCDTIPFPDDHFDLARCFDVLEHIYDRWLFAAVKEIVRVSKNIICRMPMTTDNDAHGKLVNTTHDTTHAERLGMVGLQGEPLRPCIGFTSDPVVHPSEHSRDFWVGLFDLLGMRDTPLEERFYHEPHWSSNLLSSWNSILVRKPN